MCKYSGNVFNWKKRSSAGAISALFIIITNLQCIFFLVWTIVFFIKNKCLTISAYYDIFIYTSINPLFSVGSIEDAIRTNRREHTSRYSIIIYDYSPIAYWKTLSITTTIAMYDFRFSFGNRRIPIDFAYTICHCSISCPCVCMCIVRFVVMNSCVSNLLPLDAFFALDSYI